ncbi:hypothetical protein [Devosia sp. CN2-171]|uniref:hypothetical protein n=1 Tax=Devosia sp. CN2-171 TaxID=3400909 RepID=UPI003BF79393
MISVAAATTVSATAVAIGSTPTVTAAITTAATPTIGALAPGSPDHNEKHDHTGDDNADGKQDVFHGHRRHSPATVMYELKDMRA